MSLLKKSTTLTLTLACFFGFMFVITNKVEAVEAGFSPKCNEVIIAPNDEKVTFSWSAVPGAVNYMLHASGENNFFAFWYKNLGNVLSTTTTGINNAGLWRWSLYAQKADGSGSWVGPQTYNKFEADIGAVSQFFVVKNSQAKTIKNISIAGSNKIIIIPVEGLGGVPDYVDIQHLTEMGWVEYLNQKVDPVTGMVTVAKLPNDTDFQTNRYFSLRITQTPAVNYYIYFPVIIPPAPIVTSSPVCEAVSLSWSSVVGATKYNVLDNNGNILPDGVIDASKTTYNHSGLAPGNYKYSVVAVGQCDNKTEKTTIDITVATCQSVSVIYNGNGNTGGAVPVDTNKYSNGQNVTVLGNTGNLVKEGHTFAGWNTKADGSGSSQPTNSTLTFTSSSPVISTPNIWFPNTGANKTSSESKKVLSISTSNNNDINNYIISTSSESTFMGVAADPVNGYVWFTNLEDGSVYKINSSNGTLVSKTYIGGRPTDVALDASGNVWVTNTPLNNVSKINASTGAVINTISVGTSPAGVAVDGSGNIWVANLGSNTVSKIKGSNGDLIKNITFPVGSGPSEIAIDASGNIWVTNLGSNTVSKIDSSTNEIVKTITVRTHPFGIAVDGSGNIWVTHWWDSRVVKIDNSINNNVTEYDTGYYSSGITVDKDGNVWFTELRGEGYLFYIVKISPDGLTTKIPFGPIVLMGDASGFALQNFVYGRNVILYAQWTPNDVTPLTATCSYTSDNGLVAPTNFTWTATSTGGTPSYVYNWAFWNIATNTWSTNNGTPIVKSYTSAGTQYAYLTATDKAGSGDSVTVICPGTVTDGGESCTGVCGPIEIIVNGVCKTGGSYTAKPTENANLCTSGTATAVTGTGELGNLWTWDCNGSGTGHTDANGCTATKTESNATACTVSMTNPAGNPLLVRLNSNTTWQVSPTPAGNTFSPGYTVNWYVDRSLTDKFRTLIQPDNLTTNTWNHIFTTIGPKFVGAKVNSGGTAIECSNTNNYVPTIVQQGGAIQEQ